MSRTSGSGYVDLDHREELTINHTLPISTPASVAPVKQPRARGDARVGTKLLGARTVLDTLRQAGSSKLVFPRSAGSSLQAVLVNTAGGVTGGDRFTTTANASQGTHLGLTTQAAERAYGAQPGETGEIRNHLTIQADARIDWLPQETLLFQSSALDRAMTIDMHEGARLLFVEPLVFGREAMGERVTDLRLKDRVRINQAGVPIFMDAMILHGDASAHLIRAAGTATAFASVLYVAPDASAHLEAVRACLNPTSGATLLSDTLLHVRFCARDSFALRQSLIPVLCHLRAAPLPRTWMI